MYITPGSNAIPNTITDVTSNLGILPILLGPAKLQRTTHTFLHYYDIKPLAEQRQQLIYRHEELILFLTTSNNTHVKTLSTYEKILCTTEKSIEEKISHLKVHRTKRGLLNGLGSMIRFVTGNLDHDDEEQFKTAINTIKNSEHKLEAQIQEQYSINNQLMLIFNNSISNIQYNENELKTKITELERFSDPNVTELKDLYNQLILLNNMLLRTLEEIENSLAFCRLNTMHPSIISSHQLLSELQRIQNYYPKGFPYPIDIKSIPLYEKLISPTCTISSETILYTLSLPIDYDIPYSLYYLHPMPTYFKNELFTIIPSFKYYLINEKTIKPLNDKCTYINGKYQCSENLLIDSSNPCERNIILFSNSTFCHYSPLVLSSSIEPIYHTDLYLFVLKEKTEINIKCANASKINTLQGIFMIQSTPCDIIFNQQILKPLSPTHSSPYLTTGVNFEFNQMNFSNWKIHLKDASLQSIKIPTHHFEQLDDKPSSYTVLAVNSLATLCLLLIFVLYVSCTKKQTHVAVPFEEPLILQPRMFLPGNAKI